MQLLFSYEIMPIIIVVVMFVITCTDMLRTIGHIISKLPTWDSFPEETQKLALEYDKLRDLECRRMKKKTHFLKNLE